ncbi:MAG: hypothetical protein LLG00_14420 [Planctomycetaceae bacterium]|nr:hypothetical protein [Planctomycetaceae bacterium]
MAMRGTVAAAAIALLLGSCNAGPEYNASTDYFGQNATQPAVVHNNPAFIPVADPQCAWETTVGVLSDYFRVEREEPVRRVGDTLIEGRIRTFPEVSSTVFEPWRHDTADPEQRTENTLQTMRRWAVVRVVPAQGGHWVDVSVFKELEDLVRPEHATAGTATFRYDSSLVGIVNPVVGEPTTKGWIAQGRDASLEQRIIADLVSRCGQPAAPQTAMRGQDK